MWLFFALSLVTAALTMEINPLDPSISSVPTRTVYGFLDFTTTVSNTVMVFKPQSKPTEKAGKKLESAPMFKKIAKSSAKKKLHANEVTEANFEPDTFIESSLAITEAIDVGHPTVGIETGRSGENHGKAKLSVYKLKDVLEPISVQQPTDPKHKLGLISKYGGTVIKNGVTTVHETSVIGTYVEGKYAQMKSSTSKVFYAETSETRPAKKGSVQVVLEDNPKIQPAVIHAAIAVTAAPRGPFPNTNENLPLESLFGITNAETTTTRRTFKPTPKTEALKVSKSATKPSAHNDFLNRLQRHRQVAESLEDAEVSESIAQKSVVKPSRFSSNRNYNTRSTSTTTEAPSVPQTEEKPRYTRRAGYVVSKNREKNIENDFVTSSESPRVVAVRKLQNTGERWRYLASPKPVINIQGKNRFQQHREEKTTEPTTTTAKYEEQDYDEAYNNYSNQEPYNNPEKQEYYDSLEEPVEVKPEVEPTVVTLHVQTVTPTGYSDIYFEVATIKSPQVMRIGTSRSTRYQTVTKTHTKYLPQTYTTESVYQEQDAEEPIEPSAPYIEDTPYTEAFYDPNPEEQPIVQEVMQDNPTEVESDYMTEPSMTTVTETFSTVELMTKTSVVPFVRGKISTQIILTQSFYITRVITAVKTVPAELYLPDLAETPLDEAGTQNLGRLANGELDFPEDYDGPNQKRVLRQPYSSKTDLSEIGNDFQPSDYERVELEPSLVDPAALLIEPTPPLGGVSTVFAENFPSIDTTSMTPMQEAPASLSPEQMQQLAMMRYMNPYAANPYAALNPYMNHLGYGLPQMNPGIPQVSSRPVLRTSEILRTDLIPIWNGVSTIYSTLTRKLGFTTVTDYETVTNTAAANPFLQYTVTSSPVTVETITTSTDYRTYRIIFRAQTTVTTVTSLSVFPTIMTSYVTSSVAIQPSVYPGMYPGMGGVPFPGFLG